MTQSQKPTHLEQSLLSSRFFILIAVILNAIIGIILLIKGSILFFQFLLKLTSYEIKYLMIESLTILDLFLVGIVFFIFSFSIYEIFINNKKESKFTLLIPQVFLVKDLDSLKNKLVRGVLLILNIFFRNSRI